MKTFKKGFTLIELLLVIGIIAILAAIVIVAINPTRQLGQARNAQRNSDVNTLLNAIWQFAIDNSGDMPTDTSNTSTIDGSWRMLGTATSGCASVLTASYAGATNHCGTSTTTGIGTVVDRCLNLTTPLSGNYVVSLPRDPRYSAAIEPGKSFYVVQNSGNRVTVRGCLSEASAAVFQVTR